MKTLWTEILILKKFAVADKMSDADGKTIFYIENVDMHTKTTDLLYLHSRSVCLFLWVILVTGRIPSAPCSL